MVTRRGQAHGRAAIIAPCEGCSLRWCSWRLSGARDGAAGNHPAGADFVRNHRGWTPAPPRRGASSWRERPATASASPSACRRSGPVPQQASAEVGTGNARTTGTRRRLRPVKHVKTICRTRRTAAPHHAPKLRLRCSRRRASARSGAARGARAPAAPARPNVCLRSTVGSRERHWAVLNGCEFVLAGGLLCVKV